MRSLNQRINDPRCSENRFFDIGVVFATRTIPVERLISYETIFVPHRDRKLVTPVDMVEKEEKETGKEKTSFNKQYNTEIVTKERVKTNRYVSGRSQNKQS